VILCSMFCPSLFSDEVLQAECRTPSVQAGVVIVISSFAVSIGSSLTLWAFLAFKKDIHCNFK
jgi:hypothetical protein